MIYVYVLLFFVWNMCMASILTIPLYKIVCNLSYLDQSYITYSFSKEYLLYSILDPVFYFFFDSLKNESIAFVTCDVHPHISIVYILLQSHVLQIDHFLLDFVTDIDVSYSFAILTDAFLDVQFISRVSNFALMEFLSLQKSIIVNSGESTLVFFRIYNPTSFDITGISLYYIFPINAAIHVNKVQCFCFDLLTVTSLESVELPIIFYVTDIFLLKSVGVSSLIISYILFIN